MVTPETLAESFGLNVRIMRMQADGLSHEDSLLQPTVRGNCMNWVLGHILHSRNRIVTMLGGALDVQEDALDRYRSGSEPVTTDEGGLLRLEDLLEYIQASQRVIDQRLPGLTQEDLERLVGNGDRSQAFGTALFGVYFHDTYHTGQLEFLRQLTGVGDKVI